jgi:nucleoside-diphosphate-sugar epimerase
MVDIDITNQEALRNFLSDKKNNIKVVINLAALLSAVADQKPELAHKINYIVPKQMMEMCHQLGIRKLQIMSSMASQEFGPEPDDSPDIVSAKERLQQNSSTKARFPAKGKYGRQKSSIEVDADYYASQMGMDVSIPCLAGVLNAHTPWPSNGTTEELDKMVVAAALHKVYGAQWEAKLREFIIQRDGDDGKKALDAGHYIRNGVYVPEVTGDTKFAMIDGETLAEAVLMLLHQDSRKVGPVQNVYEYTARMMDAASALKSPGLNPDFPVDFAVPQRHLPIAAKTEPAHMMDVVDSGKMHRAKIWAHGMDTSITESIIGNFKRLDAEQSIKSKYDAAVKAFQEMKLKESSIAVAPQAVGGGVGKG